jgi:hypothetical protein
VRLLYADDREKARETALQDDGSFSVEYVPEGKYILQISGAHDEEQNVPGGGQGDDSKPTITHIYADKEISMTVLNDTEGINLTLSARTPTAAAPPNSNQQ